MAIETELKLSLPASALTRLRQHPLLAGIRPQRQRLENIYYDTEDLLLKASRLAVRHRRTAWGWLLTVKSAEPAAGGLARRSEWEAPSLPDAFDFSHVDSKPVHKQLDALKPRLLPAFTTDFLRTTWLISPQPGTSIEVALDRGRIRCGGREEAICELELELIEGPVSALFALAQALQADIPLRPECASKAERGYGLFLHQLPSPVRAAKTPVETVLSPDEAFASVALACIEQLQRNEAGARAGENPEFVHQARIAIRRLRSALRLWAPLLPSAFLEKYRPAWRELARQFGEARNLDVLATQTLPAMKECMSEHPALRRFSRLLDRQRTQAHRELRAALECPDFPRLVLGFTADLHALPQPLLADSLPIFARHRLKRLADRLSRQAVAAGNDPQALHALRIAFKRLRYALEFMAPLYSSKALRPYLRPAAEIQELLGAMNDIVIAEAHIADHPSLASDTLIRGWLGSQRAHQLDNFPRVLEKFLHAPRPWKQKA